MAVIEPGTVLKSRYKISQQLGKGGMGEVFLAVDETLDTRVAVKTNHNLASHTSAQFIREARLLASLKHPNLPRVIDYFTDDDSQYLVMDYIPGDNLKEIVDGKKKLTLDQVTQWAIQLGNALSYLHTQNPPIYHRDVKPANIKLTDSNEVVLVDFGIAKTGDASQETQTGAWAFSPGFAPPEQVSGMRTGPYSDQFSLAATIYFLLAGKPPADSARRLMGEEEYIPLTSLNPKIPAHFSAAMDKALSIKPEGRFATVDAFILALTNPGTLPATEAVADQKTVLSSSRVNQVPGIPPPTAPVYSESQPQIRKKTSPIWVILGIFIALGVLTGGFFALRSTGLINFAMTTPTEQVLPSATIEEPKPTITPPFQMETPSVAIEEIFETEAPVVFNPVGRGGKVAFISDRQGDGYKQVWVMEVGMDGNNNPVAQNFEQITFSPNDKSNPSWSPDGTKLIYSGLSTEFSANGSPFAADIWIIDLTQPEQEPIDISRRPGDDFYAAWSPNGKHIAFTSYYREDKTPQHVLMNPDGSNQTLLSILGFSDTYSTWSPNGDWLLYVFSTGNLKVLQMRYQSDFINNVRKFDQSSNEGRLGNVIEPSISSDGSMIAYTRVLDNAKTNIYTAVFADRGRTVTQMTDSGMDYAPCWSPDGKWILFTSERDGDPEIYIMDSEGGQIANLSQMPSIDSQPSWQPPKSESQE